MVAAGAVRVAPYVVDDRPAWDQFVASAKNGVFLFQRGYMEYHANRFEDASLVVWDGSQVVAALPANRVGDLCVSHGGLTFGGLMLPERSRTSHVLELFHLITDTLRSAGFRRLVYKAIPHIYHRVPAEEDLYALFRLDARLVRRDISSTIDYRKRLRFSKGRRWASKRARTHGLEVRETDDWDAFIAVERDLLEEKYGATPVHTPEELRLLASRFPENISLHGAYHSGELVAGVVVYGGPLVAHAQYIAATEAGKRLGALDLILEHLINERFIDRRYFDFGISTEREGRYLNEPLIENKEGFGARPIVYDTYELVLQPR